MEWGQGFGDEATVDGYYVIALPGMPVQWIREGPIDDTRPKAYGFMYVKGEIVDIKTPPVNEELHPWIKAASKLRDEFLKYLERAEVPHKELGHFY